MAEINLEYSHLRAWKAGAAAADGSPRSGGQGTRLLRRRAAEQRDPPDPSQNTLPGSARGSPERGAADRGHCAPRRWRRCIPTETEQGPAPPTPRPRLLI